MAVNLYIFPIMAANAWRWMGIATAVGWRKLNSLCFFSPGIRGLFLQRTKREGFHYRKKPSPTKTFDVS